LGNIFIALGLFSLTGVFVYGGLAIWNMKLANVPTYLFFSILIKYFLYFAPVAIGLLLVKFWFNVSPLIIAIVGVIASAMYLAMVVREDDVLSKYLDFIPFMRTAGKI
jgi:hypothetical protein